MTADKDDIRAFSIEYSREKGRRAIAVSDVNRDFRASVVRFVAGNLQLAPTGLIRDLVIEEAKWSNTADIDIDSFAILLSELLMREGGHGIILLGAVVGRNMDLDGTLMSGGLLLTEDRKSQLMMDLQRATNPRPEDRFDLIKRILERAQVSP
jgi:hypothetical protein